jgi:hypothetical protein
MYTTSKNDHRYKECVHVFLTLSHLIQWWIQCEVAHEQLEGGLIRQLEVTQAILGVDRHKVVRMIFTCNLAAASS